LVVVTVLPLLLIDEAVPRAASGEVQRRGGEQIKADTLPKAMSKALNNKYSGRPMHEREAPQNNMPELMHVKMEVPMINGKRAETDTQLTKQH
jgi:hypothetical protein